MLNIDMVGQDDLRRLLGSDIVNKAMVSALNKIGAKAATAASRQIRDKYVIAAKNLRKRGTSNRRGIDVVKARLGHAEAIILSSGQPLPLANFRVSPKTPVADQARKRRKGIRYQVVKGKRVQVKTAFVARMRSGHVGVFRRTTKARLPIRELFGPSIPQMFGEQQTLDSIFRTVAADAPEILQRELEFQISKAAGRE